MTSDRTEDRAPETEFEHTEPFPGRGLALAMSVLFAAVGLVAGIAWRPEALLLLVPAAAGSAANWWGNFYLHGQAEQLDLRMRFGRLTVWRKTILYATIEQFKVCPMPFIANPFTTLRFGHIFISGAVRLQLARGPLSIPRPADVVYVSTSEPEELVAFLRTRVAPAEERRGLPAPVARLHYAHREFCPIGVAFWVGTAGFAVGLFARHGSHGFPNELINTLLGIGAFACCSAALCTSYLHVRDDYTDLAVSYGPIPLAGARLPYRLIKSVNEDWLDFFRVVWGALPGQPRCFVGHGRQAVRVTLSESRADLGHSREVVIGTNDAEGLMALLRARMVQVKGNN